MKVYDLLIRTAAGSPEKPAAVYLDKQISYGELYDASQAVAARLNRLDLPTGSRAAILFENSLDYIVSYFGVLAAGLVAVPLDTSLAPEDINYILTDSGTQVLLAGAKYQRHFERMLTGAALPRLIISDRVNPKVKPLAPLERLDEIISASAHYPNLSDAAARVGETDHSDDLAAIFYTSGSTGKSKGVMLSHRNLVSNTLATVKYLRLRPDDSVLVILPFYYIYGNSLLLTHVTCGGKVIIENGFMYVEVVLDSLERSRATGFSGVPSTFTMALSKSTIARRKLEHLRYITQAGGPMAPEVTRKLMAACPNQEIWIMYGQTEAAPRVTYLPPEKLDEKMGSIGIPVPGVEVRIIDDRGRTVADGESGEIVVDGPNVMLGYWNQPDDTKTVLKEGCLYTGDLARRDDEGYIFIIGRKREIIKSAGHRVSAKEVEEKILEDDRVAEVAVVGIPNEVLGEAICAVVVLHGGATADTKDIQLFCQKRMAAFKVPKIVEFLEVLPKYQSGKINKLELKQRYTESGTD